MARFFEVSNRSWSPLLLSASVGACRCTVARAADLAPHKKTAADSRRFRRTDGIHRRPDKMMRQKANLWPHGLARSFIAAGG